MQATQTPDYTTIKTAQQATWASGDYAAVAARIQHIADSLVEAADLHAGWRVLDVATGSGNAALAAARADTQVVGVDYVPELLAVAQERAAAERLSIEFREGDAEQLPVGDGEFDAVVSVVGAMFAPNQAQAAKELTRACRPGGTIALASWTPTSFIGNLFQVVSGYAPPPPGVVSPMNWGNEAQLADLLGDEVDSMRSTEKVHVWRFTSAEALVGFFEQHYGPTLKAFGRQDEADRARLQADLVELAREADTRRDGRSIAVPATYLETVCRRV